MKKILFILGINVLVLSACQRSENRPDSTSPEEVSASHRNCASHEVLQAQLNADPSLRTRMQQIETFTEDFVRGNRLLPNGTIEIPVVVNVVWRTPEQNISLEQIQSQIDVLNDDFAGTNDDYNNTPSIFQGVLAGNTGVKFKLVGVVRRQTNKRSWQANDAMKRSQSGGIDATNPTTTLNFWVCNLGGGLLGYAQFPGGPAATDGIVCDDNATGTIGTAAAPFDGGRTATHEVGHWLNLRHIWGDANCGNDFVDDTPLHNTYNFGCPSYPHLSTCAGNPVEMTMNYMDYTDDACMFMFTGGQKTRMLATFASGGPRNSFAQP